LRSWLIISGKHYEATGEAPGAAAINAALNLLEDRVQFDGVERPVHIRVAEQQGRIYRDLADEPWRAVEIEGRTGTQIIRLRGSRPNPVRTTVRTVID
jgi:hypothetical protein